MVICMQDPMPSVSTLLPGPAESESVSVARRIGEVEVNTSSNSFPIVIFVEFKPKTAVSSEFGLICVGCSEKDWDILGAFDQFAFQCTTAMEFCGTKTAARASNSTAGALVVCLEKDSFTLFIPHGQRPLHTHQRK
jgi:hypothetical protein